MEDDLGGDAEAEDYVAGLVTRMFIGLSTADAATIQAGDADVAVAAQCPDDYQSYLDHAGISALTDI